MSILLTENSIETKLTYCLFSFFLFRNIIEDGILSQENQNECHMPDLPVDSPEMLAFLQDEPPIQCDDVEAWVSCGSDRKVISKNA